MITINTLSTAADDGWQSKTCLQAASILGRSVLLLISMFEDISSDMLVNSFCRSGNGMLSNLVLQSALLFTKYQTTAARWEAAFQTVCLHAWGYHYPLTCIVKFRIFAGIAQSKVLPWNTLPLLFSASIEVQATPSPPP